MPLQSVTPWQQLKEIAQSLRAAAGLSALWSCSELALSKPAGEQAGHARDDPVLRPAQA